MIKDHGAILAAGVTELRIGGQGIDVAPEHIEQFFVADFRWIIGDLYRFRVAGATGANFFVSRILFSTADIAGNRRNHAFKLVVWWFHTPKTTAGKRGFSRRSVAGGRSGGMHNASYD